MLLANILLAVTTSITLLLSLFILVSNPRRALNRVLTSFIFGCFIWLLANLLTNISSTPRQALFFGRTTLIGPVLIAYFFLIFAKLYSKAKNFGYSQVYLFAVAPLLILATTFTKLNIVSIGAYGADTVTGLIYDALVPLIVVYFGWGLIDLVRFYRTNKDTLINAQIRYIFIGVILSLIPSLITNGILPLLGQSSAVFYGPNTIVLLAVMMSLAIVRHQLLDIRLIVARSFAYVLSLAALGGLFALVAFTVTGLVFRGQMLGGASLRGIYTVLAVALALLLPPFKRFFDKFTNRLFFRDSYDTQNLLDQFNKVLVTTYDLDTLLNESAEIIKDNLKPTYCMFGIAETSSTSRRISGTAGHPSFDENDINFVRDLTPRMHRNVILADRLEREHRPLQALLQANDISIIARLTSKPLSEEATGYLILGPKNSGNAYSAQDVKVIEILANELVIAIQNALHTEEIQDFNLTLQQKVDDATHKLRQANERLRALDETKDDFISMASHQLRTPLTSVKGYLSLVLDGDAGRVNAQQRQMLQQAYTSSQRMVFLIADLLNVSRLKTGKFIIDPAPVNLADIVASEMDQLVATASLKNLELVYDQPSDFPDLMLDETKSRQVIMNFIDNAIYYTPEGGKIEVKLALTRHAVEFRVVDNGIGVPASERHHLFSKFYRAKNAQKARPDGTGLGLFMAKKVIVAEGGSIIFDSEENVGSTFGFSFPLAKIAAKPAKPLASSKESAKEPVAS